MFNFKEVEIRGDHLAGLSPITDDAFEVKGFLKKDAKK